MEDFKDWVAINSILIFLFGFVLAKLVSCL